jgi:hypothetical protein
LNHQDHDLAFAARVAHEVNRAYCLSLGDTTTTSWEDAPESQRVSCIAGMRFHVQNPMATPRDSHNAWLRTKHAEGWTWGPVKDETTKKHPCMQEYDKLPLAQQVKDHLFKAVARTVLGIG